MGFFSRRDDDSLGVIEESEESKLATKRAWVEGISDEDAKKLFDDLESAFDDVKRTNRSPINRRLHAVGAIGNLNLIEQEWLKIDRKKLNDKDVARVYDTVVSVLPAIAGDYRKYSSSHNVSVALDGFYLTGNYRALDSRLTARDRLTDCLGKLTEIQHNQWKSDYVASITQNTLSVPSVRGRDRELRTAVEGLHGLWVKANDRKLNEVDRFYVEEVASRYFPDAWRMFRSFEASNEELYAEARTIFLEQVGLMGRRLKSMVTAEVREASLQELKAHSTFLREVSATR